MCRMGEYMKPTPEEIKYYIMKDFELLVAMGVVVFFSIFGWTQTGMFFKGRIEGRFGIKPHVKCDLQ